MVITLEYFEFDYKNQRHHCLEMKPIPITLRIVRFIIGSKCKYVACADHLEIFCMTHPGHTIRGSFTPNEIKLLRQYVKEAQSK